MGFEERIDHRSYKEQGLDKEPMVHLGYEAAALERKGIKTERGDYNRAVQQRNAERAAIKTEAEYKAESSEESHSQRKLERLEQIEEELRKMREVSWRMEKPLEDIREPETPFVSELEKQLKTEKAIQHIEKMQAQQHDAANIAKHMSDLRDLYVELEVEKVSLMETHNAVKHDLPPLEYRAELLDEHIRNIDALQGRAAQLQEVRRNLSLFEFKKKKDADEKIRRAEQEIIKAQEFFGKRFHIDPAQAHEELRRLHEEIRMKKDDLNTKQILVQTIREKQEKLELEPVNINFYGITQVV